MAEVQEYKIREKQGYMEAMMEALVLSDKEASGDGLLQEYEDLIDSWWADIPTMEKVRKKVYDETGEKRIPALEAWKGAMAIQPPEDVPEARKHKHMANKERALRKKQIIIDLLHEQEFLFKRPPISRMKHGDDEEAIPWE